eukprot:Skav214062  [mRNA]  locus=scaffold2017:694813:699466:+ [translate_table: standard]
MRPPLQVSLGVSSSVQAVEDLPTVGGGVSKVGEVTEFENGFNQVEPDLVGNTPHQKLYWLLMNGNGVECGRGDLRFEREVVGLTPSVLQLGISNLQLLLRSPKDGTWLKSWLFQSFSTTYTPPVRDRDLLPFALPPVGAAVQMLSSFQRKPCGSVEAKRCSQKGVQNRQRQQKQRVLVEGCKQLWRVMVMGVLSGFHCSWNPLFGRNREVMTSSQKESMKIIDEWVAYHCRSCLDKVSLADFSELVKKKQVDYSGEESTVALPLKVRELLPGLPEPGVAGSLEAVKAASPQRGIVESIKYDDIFRAKGKVVLNGAFAVEKKGEPLPGEARITRLIMNFIPSHDEDSEWRRDRPMPLRTLPGKRSFVQYYLDDFDAPELVSSVGWEEKVGKMSESHVRQREAYKYWGVGISEGKAHVREPAVERMGAEIDGVRGAIGVPLHKKVETSYFSLWILQQRFPLNKARMMALGRWVRAFEFRRPLMHLLQECWPKGDVRIRRPMRSRAREEFLECIALSVLAGTDLRAQVDPMASCSDASEQGGGLCIAGGLTDMGHAMLTALTTRRPGEATPFQPLGAVSVKPKLGPRVFVVSLFDGISALMCGLCRLDIQVVGFASSEVDTECKRFVRKRWPGVIELGDITKITQDMLETLAKSSGHQIDFVIAGGGSPCQDLSSLLAGGQGLDGSRSSLFFEMPRIFKGLKVAFNCPVFTFVENVFSMTEENRSRFSGVLGYEPVLLDCSWFSWCRRPRLFWCNWDVIADPSHGEQMIQHDGYQEWIHQVHRLPHAHWVDPGCSCNSSGLIPTLTRSLPRKNPPRSPAGLTSASAGAIDRWRSDSYRFQVYQYEVAAMVTKPDNSLRTLSLTERESLMGFQKGYVAFALSPKMSVQQSFNVGACMIGNSFNVHSIAMLMDSVVASFTQRRSPRHLGSILEVGPAAPQGWCSAPNFRAYTPPNADSQLLVEEYMRQADRGGSDVKQRQARKTARQGLTLKKHLVTSQLHKRYLSAAARVLTFWDEANAHPSTWDDFDTSVSMWLEHIFAEGLPKGYGSDALAAIQHFVPEVAGKLRNSWRLLKAWNKMEPPMRVLPISPLIIAGMAGLCVRLGWYGSAAALLVGFDCLLRPGEIYNLKVQDITWASGKATLTLHSTKTGLRKGAEELVFCESQVATKWLKRACVGKSPHSYVMDRSRTAFRSLFFRLLEHFEIEGYLSLYSLRRGGATWHFLAERSMESTLVRGRWQSTSTARIYLADAAATLVHLRLSRGQTSALTACSRFL